MSHIHNVISLVAYATKMARDEKFKKHHRHCAVIKTYDNRYQSRLKKTVGTLKISG